MEKGLPLYIENINKYHAVRSCWDFSHTSLNNIKSYLEERLHPYKENIVVAVAGSFGRMEASKESDLDYIIINMAKNPPRRILNS